MPRDFETVFNKNPDFMSRASGRVELIGGHTDYNNGFVIAAALNESCYTYFAQRNDNIVNIYSDLLQKNYQFLLSSDLKRDDEINWPNYVIGIVANLINRGLELKGVDIFIKSDVPLGAGLSSSAAFEIATANGFLHLIKNNSISKTEIAELCQNAENVFAQSPCGIMDQLVSIKGQKGKAVFLDCKDNSTKLVPFDDDEITILIVNSMVQHEVGGGEYGKRRDQCRKAVKQLKKVYPNISSLRNVGFEQLKKAQNKMSPLLFKRAMHVVTENERVLKAAEALENNDQKYFAELMSLSHDSARDNYEITCDEVDFLKDTLIKQAGVLGARMSGGGFGGSVVAMVNSKQVEKIKKEIKRSYREEFEIDAEMYTAKPFDGTEIIEK